MELEYRNKYALGGNLLYIASSVFVVYYALFLQGGKGDLSSAVWNVLFWLIILFGAANAVAKSFFQEGSARQLYLYTLVDPKAIIFSKLIYNQGLMLVLGALTLVLFVVMIGSPIQQLWIFLLTLFLAASSFSYIFTLISAIASKANNNATLMAVLGFPLMMPLIVFMTKLSEEAYRNFESPDLWKVAFMLLAFNIILVILSLVLFPYIWRD